MSTTVEMPVPVFVADAEGTLSRQFPPDVAAAIVVQAANAPSYRAELPDDVVTGGTGTSAAQAARFRREALIAADLSALTVPIQVRYHATDGQALGGQDIEVLVLPTVTTLGPGVWLAGTRGGGTRDKHRA